MSGGTSFFERKEIKDVISYLRVISNHDDDINLLRIINTPRRGIGRAAIQLMNEAAELNGCTLWNAIDYLIHAEASKASDILKEDLQNFVNIIEENRQKLLSGRGLANKVRQFVDDIDYKSYHVSEYPKSEKAVSYKLKNIEEFTQFIDTWENDPDNTNPNLYNYLNRITLASHDNGDDESNKGKVNLMTIHASKGLEFPVVFIAGVEEGLIPHARSVEENNGDVEEERRLFYVAITRAQEKLIMTSCQKRKRRQFKNDDTYSGSPFDYTEVTPSRFLDEIPENLVEYHQQKQLTEEETGAMFSDFLSTLKSKM